MNQHITGFFQSLKGKHIAVCGVGKNNTPVIRQLLGAGAVVTACDKRSREAIGDTITVLEQEGAVFQLGENYLSGIDSMDMILRTPGMKPYLPEFEAARKKGVTVTSEMELFFELCPASIFAVTGSDGKTTTTTIIAKLLEKAGHTVHLGGNIGRPLLPIIEKITPTDLAVIELSSFQLTMMTQSPHVGVITNIAPNHLDWHTDMQEYTDAKKNLIAHQKAGDRAVINADNAVTASFAEVSRGQTCFFSRQKPVEEGAFLGENGKLYYQSGGHKTEIMTADEIKLPGVHNIENYLAAITAVWGYVSPQQIREFAMEFGGVPHRCELVTTRNGVRWYNDSIGTSPSRTIAGLKAFDRKVILIAGGYDKHIPYAPLGEVVPETVKTAILLGATADKIEAAIREHADLPIVRVASMEEAVETADRLAREGDIVFMSPASASFDMYKNFEERGEHFKRVVENLL